jgi:hypothetical protein
MRALLQRKRKLHALSIGSCVLSRQDRVEDVNAVAHDFLRPIRSNLQAKPPDADRIHALADQLSASGSLAKIAKNEPLKRYRQLYILTAREREQVETFLNVHILPLIGLTFSSRRRPEKPFARTLSARLSFRCPTPASLEIRTGGLYMGRAERVEELGSPL